MLGVFDFLKNDYRIVISITLISSMVFHRVPISTLKKTMADAENILNDVVDTPKEAEQHKKR